MKLFSKKLFRIARLLLREVDTCIGSPSSTGVVDLYPEPLGAVLLVINAYLEPLQPTFDAIITIYIAIMITRWVAAKIKRFI